MASPEASVETRQLWAVVFSLVLAWGLARAWSKRVAVLALVPPVVLGLMAVGRALQSAWLADDAFITFRYSANWAHGLGPVWNAGERVEGYTNPLWMAVLALGESLGAPAPWLAAALNLLVLFVFIAALWLGLRRAFPASDAIPVLPVVLALSPAVREFGTSGLETLPASASVTFAALSLLLGSRPRVAATFVCLAALLRPDHALFFAPLGLAVVSSGTFKERLRSAADLIGPSLVFAAFWLVRWRWYGDFYPNTYYAKSAALPYWEQGQLYVTEFVSATRVWWPVLCAPIVAVALWLGSRRSRAVAPMGSTSRAPFFLFTVVGGLLWLLYVARVGGDFMEFRFALSALPLLGLAAEVLVWSQQRAPFFVRLASAFVVLLPLAQAKGLVPPREKVEHIALESSFYPVDTWDPLVLDNLVFREAVGLAATNPPRELLAIGCVGMVGYYNLAVPIFDTYAKTSRELARRPVEKRGRPGHEKPATREDLLKAGVVWSLDPVWSATEATKVPFKDGTAWLVRLEPEAVEWAGRQGRSIDAKQLLAQVTDASTAAERLEELESLYEPDRPSLDARFTSLGVTAPRAFTCDELRRVCTTTLECRDEWLQVQGDPACVVAVNDASATRAQRCDGSAKVAVQCSSPRANWVLSRVSGDEGARIAAAQRQSARAVAQVARLSTDPTARLLWLDFEADGFPEATKVSGDAMTMHQGTAAQQLEVRGFFGASLINTYARGDAPQGELSAVLELDVAHASVVSVLVGGGDDCGHEFVEVSVDGKPLPRACGLQDEVLREHAWLIPAGSRTLTIRAVDASSAGWGHLLLDELGVWRLP